MQLDLLLQKVQAVSLGRVLVVLILQAYRMQELCGHDFLHLEFKGCYRYCGGPDGPLLQRGSITESPYLHNTKQKCGIGARATKRVTCNETTRVGPLPRSQSDRATVREAMTEVTSFWVREAL
jgi:hypothetical protein